MPRTAAEKPRLRIRHFELSDAEPVSELIRRNLMEVNAKDYSETNIKETLRAVTPQNLILREQTRLTSVLLRNERIAGTVGFTMDDDFPGRAELHSLYVDPDHHGEGMGRLLVGFTEAIAEVAGIKVLRLSASLTAFEFYKKLGYGGQYAKPHGQFGYRIWMKKTLGEKKVV